MSNQTHQSDTATNFMEEICAYDMLPFELRVKISEAPYTISSKSVLISYKLFGTEKTLTAIDQMIDYLGKTQ